MSIDFGKQGGTTTQSVDPIVRQFMTGGGGSGGGGGLSHSSGVFGLPTESGGGGEDGGMGGILGTAQSLLGGVPDTPGFFPGAAVAGMDPRLASGLSNMYARGAQGSALEQGAEGYVQNMLGQDYAGQQLAGAQAFMAGLPGAQDALSGMAGGGMGLDDAATFAQQGSAPYEAAMQQQASGAINPLTSAMFQQGFSDLAEQFNESVIPGINATFAGAGRSGSGLQADALGNAAGELADAGASMAAQMFGGAAESALGRQLSAAQGGLGANLAQQQLAGSLYGQDANRALSAAQSLQQGAGMGLSNLGQLGAMQQGAAGMVPTMSGLDYQNLDAMQRAGAGFQAQDQREIDAARERYEYEAQRPLLDWQRQFGALGGATGLLAPFSGAGTAQSDSQAFGKNK